MLAAEKLLRRGVEEGVFPYAEWALFDRNGIESSGATAGESGRWFDLASLTKTFTATALLGLVKVGGLRLSESAGELLAPASPKLRGYLDKMSLFSLMTHTSGLPAWYPFYADGRFSRPWRSFWTAAGLETAWFTATSATCCWAWC